MDWLPGLLEILFLVGEILFDGRSQPVVENDAGIRECEDSGTLDKRDLLSASVHQPQLTADAHTQVIILDTNKTLYQGMTAQVILPSKFSLGQQVSVTKKTHPKYGQTGEVIASPRQSREGRWLVDVQFGDRAMTLLDSDLALPTTR